MPNKHCQSIQDRLGAYATNCLEASEQDEIEAPPPPCPPCPARVERLRRAATSLAPLRDEIADRKLSADRRRQILDGTSLQGHSARVPRFHRTGFRPALRWAAAAGIAAVAGLAVGLWLVSSREPSQMAARESTPARARNISEIADVEKESERREELREPLTEGMDLAADQSPAPQLDVQALDETATDSESRRAPAGAPPPTAGQKPSDAPAGLALRSAPVAESAESEPGPGQESEEARSKEMTEERVKGMRFAEETKMKKESETLSRRAESESARPEKMQEAELEALDAHGGAALAQAQLADVVAAPSPFREQHVLLGVRAARSIENLPEAGHTFGDVANNMKFDDATVLRSAPDAEGGEKADKLSGASKPAPAPVRIRFNEQTVRSQRQIADRSSGGAYGRLAADFDAVYELALNPAPAENRERKQETEAEAQLNVATLEAVAPRRQLTQQINISSPNQTLPDLTRVNQAAQTHPELYLDACEDELERLAVHDEDDSKNGKRPILHQMQAILQAVADVRPDDPRTQTLLERVNRQLEPTQPATDPK